MVGGSKPLQEQQTAFVISSLLLLQTQKNIHNKHRNCNCFYRTAFNKVLKLVKRFTLALFLDRRLFEWKRSLLAYSSPLLAQNYTKTQLQEQSHLCWMTTKICLPGICTAQVHQSLVIMSHFSQICQLCHWTMCTICSVGVGFGKKLVQQSQVGFNSRTLQWWIILNGLMCNVLMPQAFCNFTELIFWTFQYVASQIVVQQHVRSYCKNTV